MIVTGMPSTPINVDVTGQTAVLSDGLGNTLTFDPFLYNVSEYESVLLFIDATGSEGVGIGGIIDFTGNEVAGTYSSTNAGGTGFLMTVNY